MRKARCRTHLFVGGFALWLLLLSGLAQAQSQGTLRSVLLSPGARCGFLGDCALFDEIGLHLGTAAAVRTDSTRSSLDVQGAVRLSLTVLDLAEGGVSFAGHLNSDGSAGLRFVSSPVSLFARLRLLPLPLGRLSAAPLRLALSYQHDLVADPFGPYEPPGLSRGTLRLIAGQSLGRVELEGHIGFVLAQPAASRPELVAFDLGAVASLWLWRAIDEEPAGEFRLTAEALARFSLHPGSDAGATAAGGAAGRARDR